MWSWIIVIIRLADLRFLFLIAKFWISNFYEILDFRQRSSPLIIAGHCLWIISEVIHSYHLFIEIHFS